MSERASVSGEVQVKDEEGIVDRKTKEQILSLREQIDADERRLYVELMAAPDGITKEQADQYWGVSVRQYLRGIKRLWNDHEEIKELDIQNIDRYWKDIPIGTIYLNPPDKDGIPFSKIGQSEAAKQTMRRKLDLPRGAELPEPEPFEFTGLRSVLHRKECHATWSVLVGGHGPPPEHEYLHLETSKPVPQRILETAVETADNFLQQAGVGFETKVDPYEGGEEPGL